MLYVLFLVTTHKQAPSPGLSSTVELSFPIGPLYLNETGKYVFTCVASNLYRGDEITKILEVEVIVGYPARWVNGTWPVVETIKGDSAVLACQFSGIPQPVVTWKRNGVNLPLFDDQGNSNHVVCVVFLYFVWYIC